MKKLIWGLVIVAVVAVFGGRAWWLYQHRDTNDNVVKVGVVTFRGAFAKMGQDVDNGMILAKEEFQKTHPNMKVELFFEDGKGIAKDAVSAFNKLMIHDVKAFIITGDNMVPVLAPLVAEKKLPTIVTIVGSNSFAKNNSPRYMHKNNFSVDKASELFADWFTKEHKEVKTVSLLTQNIIYGLEGAEAFANTVKKNGLTVLKEEKFRETDTDVRPVVEKVLADSPDAIFVCGYGKAYIDVLNRLKENRYSGLILADKSILNPETLSSLKDKRGFLFFEVKAEQEKIDAFNHAFGKRFGKVPSSFAQDGYASMMMLLEGIDNSDKSSKGINEALKSIKEIDTVRGHMTIDERGVSSLPIFVGQLKSDGTYDILKEVE